MSATASTTPAQVPSENILSAKTDLCLSNALVKSGIGFGAGVVASAILFRRRPWPVLLGLGFGIGQGYADCERVFNPAAIPGFVISKEEGVKAPASSSSYKNLRSTPVDAQERLDKVESRVKSTAQKAETKATDLLEQAKAKATEFKDQVVGKAKEVETKVEAKSEKKWV